MKQKNADWMDMYRDSVRVREFKGPHTQQAQQSLGKESYGYLLRAGRRWWGGAERSGNDMNYRLKKKFLRKSENTTKAGDKECVMANNCYLQGLER